MMKLYSNVSIKFSIYSFRKYGQPKLSKPKELRGIRPIFSLDYIPKKCRCQVFVKDSNVWIKHRDYFSPAMRLSMEDLGRPLGYLMENYMGKKMKKKLGYSDTWGSIVLRQEAWIKIDGLVDEIKSGKFVLGIRDEIRSQQEKYHGLKELELCSTGMERFWDKLVIRLKKDPKPLMKSTKFV